MAIPTSRETLKDYCLRRLGFPVIDINVDDGQIEDRVDDALQFFSEYHFDGVEKIFFKHQITAQDKINGYINADAIDRNIVSITRCFEVDSNDVGIFSTRYQMALNDYWGLRNGNYQLSYYDITMRYLSLLQQYLDPEKTIRFSRVTNRIYLETNWQENLEEGRFLLFEAYTALNPNTYPEIYNDRLLKEYLTALIRRQWGQNLSKFEGVQMPGGIIFSGKDMLSEANEEIKRLEDEVQMRYELPPGFCVG
jgi:hypothetical protein